jgi:hypothetical protein
MPIGTVAASLLASSGLASNGPVSNGLASNGPASNGPASRLDNVDSETNDHGSHPQVQKNPPPHLLTHSSTAEGLLVHPTPKPTPATGIDAATMHRKIFINRVCFICGAVGGEKEDDATVTLQRACPPEIMVFFARTELAPSSHRGARTEGARTELAPRART